MKQGVHLLCLDFGLLQSNWQRVLVLAMQPVLKSAKSVLRCLGIQCVASQAVLRVHKGLQHLFGTADIRTWSVNSCNEASAV